MTWCVIRQSNWRRGGGLPLVKLVALDQENFGVFGFVWKDIAALGEGRVARFHLALWHGIGKWEKRLGLIYQDCLSFFYVGYYITRPHLYIYVCEHDCYHDRT